MTYEEKKEWLQRYKVARQLFGFRLQQLKTAKTDAGRTTQNISPIPGGVGDVKPCRGRLNASKRQKNA